MFPQGQVNSIGRTQRLKTIVENSQTWFNRSDVTPDPKYPPIGINRVDEFYADGGNLASIWAHFVENAGDILLRQHDFVGVGIYCDQRGDPLLAPDHHYWGTLILIDVCQGGKSLHILPILYLTN